MKPGRPARANRSVLGQQTGLAGVALERAAELMESTGVQQFPLDLRLFTRFGAWQQQGFSREDSLMRAGAWPDLYTYYMRKGDAEQLALKKLLAWHVGDPLPADLAADERPAHLSAKRVELALTRLREQRADQVADVYRHFTERGHLPVNQAILETCRMCGIGPGRADADGRGEGLSETIAMLRAAGFSEVEKSKLRSPRAKRLR